MEDKKFNGIILPELYKGISGNGLGKFMGVTQRELFLAPENLKFHIAYPTDKDLSGVSLFWLENCNPSGPYSNTACNYWVLPYLSKIPETGKMAVRVRPNDSVEEDRTPYDSEFIFWADGKPANIGHQYQCGLNLKRVLGVNSLMEVVHAWENDQYTTRFSRTIGEMKQMFYDIMKDVPSVKLGDARRALELESRDDGWNSIYPLAREVA